MIVDSKAPVPALERGLRVLALLAGPGAGGARAADLASLARIPPASFFRILKALSDGGLIAQNPHTGLYHLGPCVMFLGFQARLRSPLVAAATPVLRELSSAAHHMTELTAAIGDWQLMMMETWQSERTSLSILARPGLLFPLNHLTAPGLCYLAFDESFGMRNYVRSAARSGARQRLGIAQGVPAALTADCERYRRMGYCWRPQPNGNTRVCAPLFDPAHPRRMLAVLSIVCDSREFSLLRAAQWAPLLKSGAEKVLSNLQRTTK